MRSLLRPSAWPERLVGVGLTFAVLGLIGPALLGADALGSPALIGGLACAAFGLAAIATRQRRAGRTGP